MCLCGSRSSLPGQGTEDLLHRENRLYTKSPSGGGTHAQGPDYSSLDRREHWGGEMRSGTGKEHVCRIVKTYLYSRAEDAILQGRDTIKIFQICSARKTIVFQKTTLTLTVRYRLTRE